MTPTLTPAAAIARHREVDNQDFIHEGFTYVLDGPMGCPVEDMASFATNNENEDQWFTTGEPGDAVTDDNEWVLV